MEVCRGRDPCAADLSDYVATPYFLAALGHELRRMTVERRIPVSVVDLDRESVTHDPSRTDHATLRGSQDRCALDC